MNIKIESGDALWDSTCASKFCDRGIPKGTKVFDLKFEDGLCEGSFCGTRCARDSLARTHQEVRP